jgi:two-component sensor histidine kinase
MANTIFAVVLSVSIAIQVTAAVFAILNVTYTPRKGAWIFIATAIVLMAIRRMITLSGMIATWETPRTVAWGAEFTALIISILMVTGMVLLNQAIRELSGEMIEQQKVFRESLHASKNHFQSLASLLHTQAGFATSEPQRVFASEVEQKVSAYAILQKQLFENDYTADIAGYLSELSAAIEDAYAEPGRHAPLDLSLESFPTTPRETLYAGLIASEGLINAYKYAADNEYADTGNRGREDGPASSGPVRITISARKDTATGRRTVEVRDTGPGFPEDVLDGERGGFGTAFLRSLDGGDWTVELMNEDGAVVRVEF